MARTAMTITTVKPQESVALTAVVVDALNGMKFLNDGSRILIIYNSNVAPVTVTIRAVPDEAGRSVDYVKAIPALSTEVFGPFRPRWWNKSGEDVGYVYVDFSTGTNVRYDLINY